MVSIVTVSPARNLYEQVKWKCRIYSSLFSTVLIIYVLMALLTGGRAGSLGMGRGFIEYQEMYYSLDGQLLYSMVILMIFGWILASKRFTQENYSIVTTKTEQIISTALFFAVLCVYCFIAALSTLSIAVMLTIWGTGDSFIFFGDSWSFAVFAIFFVCTWLAASVGYFIRTVFYFSKIVFTVLLAGLFLAGRYYMSELWALLFGGSVLQSIGNSILFIVILWLFIVWIGRREEVTRG